MVRCYDDAAWGAMPAHTVPEVRTADLTAACLALAVWGSPGGEGMALPDPLPPRARADAKAELTRLSAVAEDGRATDLGRLLVSPAIPQSPVWQQIQGSAHPVHAWGGAEARALAEAYDAILAGLLRG